jgi:hypothetical protein
MSEAEKDAEIASELLENLAWRTWHRILDGHRWGIRQGETTITDYHLLEIARANSPSIKIIKTSIKKEASQGTDWEWWVGSPRQGWICYAIQAKLLGFTSGRYDTYSSLQADILINYAKNHDAVPLYCFYNAANKSIPEGYWQCCSMPFQPKQFGCTIASAQDVQAFVLKRGRRKFEEIHKNLKSASLALPCELPGDSKAIPRRFVPRRFAR